MTATGDAVTLYPAAIATPSSTLYVPITVTPALNTTIQGKIVFETATGGEIYTVIGLVDMATGKLTEPQCSQLCFVPSWNSDASGRACPLNLHAVDLAALEHEVAENMPSPAKNRSILLETEEDAPAQPHIFGGRTRRKHRTCGKRGGTRHNDSTRSRTYWAG